MSGGTVMITVGRHRLAATVFGDPDLVTAAIRDVVRCARSGALLSEVASFADGA